MCIDQLGCERDYTLVFALPLNLSPIVINDDDDDDQGCHWEEDLGVDCLANNQASSCPVNAFHFQPRQPITRADWFSITEHLPSLPLKSSQASRAQQGKAIDPFLSPSNLTLSTTDRQHQQTDIQTDVIKHLLQLSYSSPHCSQLLAALCKICCRKVSTRQSSQSCSLYYHH